MAIGPIQDRHHAQTSDTLPPSLMIGTLVCNMVRKITLHIRHTSDEVRRATVLGPLPRHAIGTVALAMGLQVRLQSPGIIARRVIGTMATIKDHMAIRRFT